MANRWLAGGLTMLGVVLLMVSSGGAKEERITKEELKALLENKDVVVIDVRVHGQYENSPLKIRGAKRENPIEVRSWAKKYSMDRTIVLYCS